MTINTYKGENLPVGTYVMVRRNGSGPAIRGVVQPTNWPVRGDYGASDSGSFNVSVPENNKQGYLVWSYNKDEITGVFA